MNIRKLDDNTYEYISQTHEEFKELQTKGIIIHFVPKNGQEREVNVLMPNTSIKKLICETNITSLNEGEVIQFERWAFCRLDKKTNKEITFWFTHE